VKADVWSVGVTACELLAAKSPFGRPSDYKGKIEPVLEHIRRYRRFADIDKRLASSDTWGSRSSYSKDFVEKIVVANPLERPFAEDCIEHAWLQRNLERPTGFNGDIIKSMARFVGASNLMRRCLLIVVARVGSPKMDRIGSLFLQIDNRHTGKIMREDLADAVSRAASCWEPEMDVDDYFDAADQENNDHISFLEFAATCLWGSDDDTSTIAERAFKALDDNHDGQVKLSECRHLFRDCDLMELRNLPMNRPFGINEWRVAVGGSDEPPMKKKSQQNNDSVLAKFIRSLICSEDDPGAQDQFEVVCQ